MIQPFFIALQFLTRLPVNIRRTPDERSTAYSLAYYPLVGLIIGALLAGFFWLLKDAPAILNAGLLLTAWVIITGGLHLDGLADSVDAWAGGFGDRERTLSIMKDPNCGPAGVVAIVLLLLLKFSALYVIVENGDWMTLLLAPVFGRTVLLLLFITTPYVRVKGLATAMASHLPQKLIFLVFITTLITVFFLAGTGSLWLMLMMLLVFIFLRVLMMSRIGGMTGDVAGALVEVTEVNVLVVAAVLH